MERDAAAAFETCPSWQELLRNGKEQQHQRTHPKGPAPHLRFGEKNPHSCRRNAAMVPARRGKVDSPHNQRMVTAIKSFLNSRIREVFQSLGFATRHTGLLLTQQGHVKLCSKDILLRNELLSVGRWSR